MKKLALLLAVWAIGSCAYSETRIIRTYSPIPPAYNSPCRGCPQWSYRNYPNYNYANRGYGRRYNSGYVNSSYYSPFNSYGGYNNYRSQGALNRFFNNRSKSIFGNTSFPPSQSVFERFRSDAGSEIVPIANIKPLKSNDARLSEIEKNVFGKDYQKQDLALRLNRLEKSMFNRTYPKMNADERIDNLCSCYNNQVKSVFPAEISELEKCVWGRSYGNESAEMRVSKLEEELLGAIQNGNLSKRIETLKQALSHSGQMQPYGTCYGGYVPQYDPNIVNDYHDGALSRFKNNLGLIFGGGCPTGWSPQLDSVNKFGFMEDGDSEGYAGNTGYAYRNTNRGTGCGIQILD